MEKKLNNPPSDGITALSFSPDTNNLLLVTSWDSTARIYDTTKNVLVTHFTHNGAILDGSFIDSSHCVSGSLDQSIKLFDIESSKEYTIGQHDQAVKCVSFNKLNGLLYSGSWDKNVKVWDIRTPTCIATVNQPGKVYSMDITKDGTKLVVSMNECNVNVYDVRKGIKLFQKRISPLKCQTRCIRCFNDSSGYAQSSVEGRVAIEYFDKSKAVQAKKYAFKCHRTKDENGVETLYPVNVIAFHPKYGTFATGGCDRLVNIWDAQNQRKVIQFRRYPTSISALSFNYDGSMLAIASSYTFEQGEQEHPPDEVYLRTITDSDVRPKQR